MSVNHQARKHKCFHQGTRASPPLQTLGKSGAGVQQWVTPPLLKGHFQQSRLWKAHPQKKRLLQGSLIRPGQQEGHLQLLLFMIMHGVLQTLEWWMSETLLALFLLTLDDSLPPLQQGCLEQTLQAGSLASRGVLALPCPCLLSMARLLLPCRSLSRALLALPWLNISLVLPCLCPNMLLPSRAGALLSTALLFLLSPISNLSRAFLDLLCHSRSTALPSAQSSLGALPKQPWHLAATALRARCQQSLCHLQHGPVPGLPLRPCPRPLPGPKQTLRPTPPPLLDPNQPLCID